MVHKGVVKIKYMGVKKKKRGGHKLIYKCEKE